MHTLLALCEWLRLVEVMTILVMVTPVLMLMLMVLVIVVPVITRIMPIINHRMIRLIMVHHRMKRCLGLDILRIQTQT